ncbi:MAG: hypothetical protein K6A32_05110 [Bacteroidales bacterium]|nr:hypothetical protein [Bacteroidales bacterium]
MKRTLTIAAMAIATMGMSLVFTSCDLFEGDGFDEKTIGNLDNERGDSDLPYGYRLKSVGDIRYSYKSNGKIDYIKNGDMTFDMGSSSLTIEEGDVTDKYKFTFNSNNLVTKIKETWREEDSDNKFDGVAEFAYDSSKRLNEVTLESTEYYEENGDLNKYTSDLTFTFTYSGKRLHRVKINAKESETIDGEKETNKYSKVIGFEYDDDDDDYINTYYQWTPNCVQAIFGGNQDLLASLAYIGMFGRASSELPYSITMETSGSSDDEDTDDRTWRCRYSKNTYDAIRSADGFSYTYTEKDDDYEVKGSMLNTSTTDEAPSSLTPTLFRCRHLK